MRDLWKLFDKLIQQKYMVRLNCWPSKGSHISLSINAFVTEHEQYLYDCHSLEELEKEVMKDFGHLLGERTKITNHHAGISTPMLPPVPKGLPLPPGMR